MYVRIYVCALRIMVLWLALLIQIQVVLDFKLRPSILAEFLHDFPQLMKVP
jgi:hypothetical protein